VASAGLVYSGAPVYAAGPIAIAPGATSSQYHAQDELGQYSYGYAGGPSAKAESKDAFGNVRGSYSYIDSNGIQQVVNYVADPVNGFRVAATNLPVGPSSAHVVASPLSAPVHYAALPVPVGDTPEVAAAKANHFQAHAEALARSG